MRFRENPKYGRKVFFINPPFAVEKKVIESLKEMEYEVYIIKQYNYAKAILRNFENAICFINIDEQLSLKGWYNFIRSFESDNQLKSVFLGIMAAKTPEASVNKFIMNLKLPGGYIKLGGTIEELQKRFCGILEINGAKGIRKYLSLTCDNIDALTGYIAYGSKLYSMSFENISSIGITCTLPDDLCKLLKKNTILQNVSLSLGRWSVITQCVVLSIKTLNGKIIAILLFTRDTPNEVKVSIRKFIYEVLNKRINEIIGSAQEDMEDYSVSKAGEGDVPDYNAPTEDDKPIENNADKSSDEAAEELEELKDDVSDETAAENKDNAETKDAAESDASKAETKTESEKSETEAEEAENEKSEAERESEQKTEGKSES